SMAMLSREACERAVRFLQEQARPLEAACFRHSFGEAPATSVVKALAAYQNGDGGYGRALEPDLRTPSSSALATSLALLRLAALGVGGKHPQVQAARAYLERSLDPQRWTWRIVPDDVGAYPHAPWWGQAGLEERFGRYLVNPRAALVAGLLHFEDTLDGDWLGQVAEDTVRAVETRELDMHELLAALALLEAPGLAVGSRARVRAACEQAAEFAEVVHVNLDVLVAAQGEEGAWSPNWSWGAYPDAWAEAQREWQGVLTLEALEALRAYGRIEDVTWRAAASNGG
ncbi:MAG: hypothetical protein P8099_09730, partial [Gemmatimonadota bacterium]